MALADVELPHDPVDLEGIDLDFMEDWTDTNFQLTEDALDPAAAVDKIEFFSACLDRCATRHQYLVTRLKEVRKAVSAFKIWENGRAMQIAVAKIYPDPSAPPWVWEILPGHDAVKVTRTDAEKFATMEATMWWRRQGHDFLPADYEEALRRAIHEVQYRQRTRMAELNAQQSKLRALEEAFRQGAPGRH